MIWVKNTFTLGRSYNSVNMNRCSYGSKDGADHYWCGSRDQGDVWFIEGDVIVRN